MSLVIGAGASRGVSYARKQDVQSPLDRDFFDLLQRLNPLPKDEKFVEMTLRWAQELPPEHWRSMETAFYTLHLNAYLRVKFGLSPQSRFAPKDDADVVHTFVNATGALLRAAHGKNTCEFHVKILENLGLQDIVISFNYDIVVERALKAIPRFRSVPFGSWLYGFEAAPSEWSGPALSKMHGSFNWMMPEPDSKHFRVRTAGWPDLEQAPSVLRYNRRGTTYPIFLPFWDKRIEAAPWIDIWRQSFKKLESSDTVLVWGYSLPQTDVKAKLFFQLALGNRQFSLCVVDPSINVRDRWRVLCPGARFWEFDNIQQFLRGSPSWWREHLD